MLTSVFLVKNHSVLRNKLFDTRGWTSLHFMFVLSSRATPLDLLINPPFSARAQDSVAQKRRW